MNKFKLTPLGVSGLIVAGLGFLIAREQQRRDIEDAVDKKIAEREEVRLAQSSNTL